MRRLAASIATICFTLSSAATAAPALNELLSAAGWTDERMASLAEKDPWSAADYAELLRLAKRLAQFDESLTSAIDSETIGRAVRFDGYVQRIEIVALPEKEAAAIGTPRGYVCSVSNEETTESNAIVVSSSVPNAWLQKGALPQPIQARGLSLSSEGANRILASSVSWSPTSPGPVVNYGEALLGQLGYNLALFDQVKDAAPLRTTDSAPFYAMLATMGDIGANQLIRAANRNLEPFAGQWRELVKDPKQGRLAREVVRRAEEDGAYSVAPMFNDAKRQQGQLVALEGVVRRAIRIDTSTNSVGDPSLAKRKYGVDHYYELQMFTFDSQNLPIVFCVRELPEGFPTGEGIEQSARIAGFFFKRWVYRTRAADGENLARNKRKLVPLLIGRAPVMLEPPAPASRATGVVVGALFVLALAAVALASWRSTKRDDQMRDALRKRFAQ